MSSPTSAPKSSIPRKINNLKLRASCDSCAASKVKCSKEHPTCGLCSSVSSPCIHGISRKHGKPGRTRKRNPDRSPFVKAAKQRPFSGSSELPTFSLQPEPTLQQTDLEIASNWASDWLPTPSLSVSPCLDLETEPESSYISDVRSYTTYKGDAIIPTQTALPEPRSNVESSHLSRDPSTAVQTTQSGSHDWQDYTGSNDVNPIDYHPTNPKTVEHLHSVSSIPIPYSPMSQTTGTFDAMVPYFNSSMENSHCCYISAYSTLDALRHVRHTHLAFTKGPFDALILTAQSATRDVLQLLNCPCSSDPHLAMLYSSITSKILTWYQTAASVNSSIQSSTLAPASMCWSGCQPLCSSQPAIPPPSVPSIGNDENFDAYMQPAQHRHYDFEDLEQ
ncbi:hypothetical protein G6011_02460 [Alternaria panax]|uniref:Zn(2)-C6 fungal-type domain-containing protein n=1 Tax=Alternaria panax TaxID=48097 RepID=A0AAD4FEV9_9PLEO|nr:hypothetical protein G6011_02460 [Alternaria panax]